MVKRPEIGDTGRLFPKARKRFGQHFLEPAWVARMVDRMEVRPDDTILEIGAGRGALTRPLAERAGRVVAVEIDRILAAELPGLMPPNVHVVEGDVLDLDLAALLATERRPVRVAGNLPYNVSSPILFRLLGAAQGGSLIADATLMLQKEVADRLVASPGSGEYGVLAVQTQLVAEVDRLLSLPPGAFRPPPKVSSAVVRLRFRPPVADPGNPATFERIVRGVFLQRRKTLANALKPVAHQLGRDAGDLLRASGIDGSRRPEVLTVAEFAALSRAVL